MGRVKQSQAIIMANRSLQSCPNRGLRSCLIAAAEKNPTRDTIPTIGQSVTQSLTTSRGKTSFQEVFPLVIVKLKESHISSDLIEKAITQIKWTNWSGATNMPASYQIYIWRGGQKNEWCCRLQGGKGEHKNGYFGYTTYFGFNFSETNVLQFLNKVGSRFTESAIEERAPSFVVQR